MADSSPANSIIEGTVKFRDGKKWKSRWCVMRKLSPVADSQKHPPIITFGKPDVVVGGLLRANCTSAPAAPAPRLTWYIDNEKIQERPRVPPAVPISLWVSIAELKAPAHGRLQLTCTATIPDEVGPGEKFADIKKQTVTVLHKGYEPEVRVTRSCGWVRHHRDCYKADNEDHLETVCQCFDNECNSATVRKSALALILGATVMMYL